MMELVYETRWSRHYKDDDLQMRVCESKFADGSASIGVADLGAQWPDWEPKERLDFCQAVTQARFPHLPDVLRFIMKEGDRECWALVATAVVRNLPKNEALPFIADASRTCPVGKGEPFFQALCFHRWPEAVPVLRECLSRTWSDRGLFSEDAVYDWVAHDATCLIEFLLQMGERSPDLKEKFNMLARHPLTNSRQNALHRLGPHFKS
jgi:hypothetical protein